jgi:hypothetical protein
MTDYYRNIRATVKDTNEVRVRSSVAVARNLEEFTNIDTTNLNDGSVLVYNDVKTDWVATRDLNQQNVDGGEF